MTVERRASAEALLIDMEVALTPALPKQITGRAFALLSQYYVGDLPSEAHAMIFSDWRDSLDDQPFWAIDAACKNHLSGRDCKKKPLPGVIAGLARHETRELRAAVDRIILVHEQRDRLSSTSPTPKPQSFFKEDETAHAFH